MAGSHQVECIQNHIRAGLYGFGISKDVRLMDLSGSLDRSRRKISNRGKNQKHLVGFERFPNQERNAKND